MNGQAFERATGEALQRLGWTVSYTPRTGDFGADIIAHCGPKKLVVQCKDYASAIAGFDALKEVHFARSHYKADEALIVSKKGFSRPVRAAAGAQKVGLLTLADLKRGCEFDRSEEWAQIQAAQRREQERFEATQRAERRRLDEQRRRREEEEHQRAVEVARTRRKQEEQKIRGAWHQYDRDLAAYQAKLPRWRIAHIPLYIAVAAGTLYLLRIAVLTPFLTASAVKSLLMGLALLWGGGAALAGYLYPGPLPVPPSRPRPDFAEPIKAPAASDPGPLCPEHVRVVEACSACGTQMRLPVGREGVVRCPTCGIQSYRRT